MSNFILPEDKAAIVKILTDAGIGDRSIIEGTADEILKGPVEAILMRVCNELADYIRDAKKACGNQTYSGQLLSEMTGELKAKADKWDRLRANPAICDFLEALLEP